MCAHCLLHYITDRTAFPGSESARRRRLLEKIAEAARAGVDYIQLREKDLSTGDLESLAVEAVRVLARLRTENRELRTALLVNSRTDVGIAAGADGVHLRSDDAAPFEVLGAWRQVAERACSKLVEGSVRATPVIGVSCHSATEVTLAAANSATFAVFAPVFEKKDAPGMPPAGLGRLREACQAHIPVLALGGVTLDNVKACLEAGAAGIAAIRLFQENDVAEIVREIRG